MRQDCEVVRHINGRDEEHVFFQLLAEELNVHGTDHECKMITRSSIQHWNCGRGFMDSQRLS
jgi:hypothetical protein